MKDLKKKKLKTNQKSETWKEIWNFHFHYKLSTYLEKCFGPAALTIYLHTACFSRQTENRSRPRSKINVAATTSNQQKPTTIYFPQYIEQIF